MALFLHHFFLASREVRVSDGRRLLSHAIRFRRTLRRRRRLPLFWFRQAAAAPSLPCCSDLIPSVKTAVRADFLAPSTRSTTTLARSSPGTCSCCLQVRTSDELLQVGDEKGQGLYVAKLVQSFCRSSSDSEG